jgi:hypothetical protein
LPAEVGEFVMMIMMIMMIATAMRKLYFLKSLKVVKIKPHSFQVSAVTGGLAYLIKETSLFLLFG